MAALGTAVPLIVAGYNNAFVEIKFHVRILSIG